MNVNLEYYKIFYYVGKYGGITLAAEKLSISQPAVSQAIRQLETVLDSRLFIRSARGVRLTSEGEVLFSYVSKGYESIRLGEKKFLEMKNMETGEIRIGASDMTLRFYLLPFLEKFHEQYPKIKVNVTNAPTPETMKYLQEGKIDFGLVSSPVKMQNDLECIQVRKIEDVFVAGSRFSYLKGKRLHYQELERLPVICLERNTSTRRYVDLYLEKHDVKMNVEFELATSDMIVQFALRNLGIASVVSDFAAEYLEKERLFLLDFEETMPKRQICVITNRRNVISTAARTLLEMLSSLDKR